TPATVNYSLSKAADRSKILIFDKHGNTVYSADVAKSEGSHSFTWNGKLSNGQDAPAGTYQFVIDAIDADDRRVGTSSIAHGVVNGVETKNGEIYLNIGNQVVNIGNVLSADVANST